MFDDIEFEEKERIRSGERVGYVWEAWRKLGSCRVFAGRFFVENGGNVENEYRRYLDEHVDDEY